MLACTSDSKKVSLQNAATRTESCSCYCILGYNRRAQICENAAHCYNLVQCCVLISLLAQDKVDRLNGFIIVNLLRTRPITLSTWILTFANFRVRATLSAESWLLPLVNAGMCNVAQYRPTLSAMSNPRSAKTTSPCDSLSKIPHCSVMCLSLVLPPQPSDMNAITPWGVIPIKNFAVLLPFY